MVADRYVIETNQLYKSYKKGTYVLEGIELKIKEGEIVGLVGPNGAGKTTLIRLLAGLLKPDRGSVKLWGVDPYSDSQEAINVKKKLSVLWEEITLDPDLSGTENINYALKLYSLPEDQNRRREILQFYLLEKEAKNKVSTYSQGMKRKLEIISVLIRKPSLLIIDELGSSLDIVAVLHTISLLRELNQKDGATLIVSSHNLRLIEKLCQRIIFINKGRIMKDVKMQELAGQQVFTMVFVSAEDKQKALSLLTEFKAMAFETDPLAIKLVVGEETKLSSVLDSFNRQGLKLMDYFEESKVEQIFFPEQ